MLWAAVWRTLPPGIVIDVAKRLVPHVAEIAATDGGGTWLSDVVRLL
jgi:hypothetical protein